MNIEKSAAAFGRQYSVLAPYYEKLNSEADYDKYADFIEREIKLYGKENTEIVLELACGTGAITRRLSERGFDMIGIDISENMLSEAYRLEHVFNSETGYKAEQRRHKSSKILYLCQDMCELELYGTAKAMVSVCDSINYLLEEDEIIWTLQSVNRYLEPGGIFIFDFNTVYKYETVLGDTTICENREEGSFIWENYYDKEEQINEYDLTLFIREEEQLYRKFEETHYQRGYSLEQMHTLVEEAGMEFLAAYDAETKKSPTADSERIYIIAGEKGK